MGPSIEALLAIATLCLNANQHNSVEVVEETLKCQKYYVVCVQGKTKGLSDLYKSGPVLASCVLEKK